MNELPFQKVNIADDFWTPRLEINADEALYHQWDQLEKTLCIHNFRITANQAKGFREGFFFSDSDAYKWLDAASRVFSLSPSARLGALIDAFIDLIEKSQMEDGYVFTYNQIFFPGRRWANVHIEHELYCIGHLIEAAVSHHQATGQTKLLAIAEKAADLLVHNFSAAGPRQTPGHPEIEIALVKLYRVTKNESYLELARHFVYRRGKIRFFKWDLLKQFINYRRHAKQILNFRKTYLRDHPEHDDFKLPGLPETVMPRLIGLRALLNFLSGKYFQQHRSVREQTIPEGHSVRFAYLETAAAMLCREKRDHTLMETLETAWDHMVSKRMFVTGGIGALPLTEGFGRDYELNPFYAYAETCAALACMFWNWEMCLLHRQAKYSDLFEWQLYNAALVGIALDGKSYLYHNPLSSRGNVDRKAWYSVPCCPSNISRTWASLGKYIYSHGGNELWIHQYIGNVTSLKLGVPVTLELVSGLPWSGKITIKVEPEAPCNFSLNLRIPGWAESYSLKVNGALQQQKLTPAATTATVKTASGYSPYNAHFVRLTRTWQPGDIISIEFPMAIRPLAPHPKVKPGRGKTTLTRGPLVYCVESGDNPGLDILGMMIDRSTLTAEFDHTLFDGIWVIRGRTDDKKPFTAIPYYCWANREASRMTVMVNG